MYMGRAPLSVHHLQTAVRPPHAYRPREILLAQFAGVASVQAATVDKPELLVNLVAFGDTDVCISLPLCTGNHFKKTGLGDGVERV